MELRCALCLRALCSVSQSTVLCVSEHCALCLRALCSVSESTVLCVSEHRALCLRAPCSESYSTVLCVSEHRALCLRAPCSVSQSTVLWVSDYCALCLRDYSLFIACLLKGSQEQSFFLQTLLFTAFLVTVLKILIYALVSTRSLVSSAWEQVKPWVLQ